MSETVTEHRASAIKDPEMLAMDRLCNRIAETNPENTQELFGNLQQIGELYYKGALTRANRSFILAQIFASVGIVYIFYLGYVCLHMSDLTKGKVLFHAFAAVLVGAISSLNFVLYNRATRQFELFHVCLERAGRFLTANSVSANISDSEKRDKARAELVSIMANAPMLPLADTRIGTKKSFRNRVDPARKA